MLDFHSSWWLNLGCVFWYFLGGEQTKIKDHMGVSINDGTPKWMVSRENPIKIDDLVVPPLWNPPHGGVSPTSKAGGMQSLAM